MRAGRCASTGSWSWRCIIPSTGYYSRSPAIGSEGDFYTSVSVGSLFGQLLARQARQMARLLGEPEFWIVEQGAHDGQMALDLLTSLRANDPAFFETVRYVIVEPSPAAACAQQRKLAGFGAQVRWLEGLVRLDRRGALRAFPLQRTDRCLSRCV